MPETPTRLPVDPKRVSADHLHAFIYWGRIKKTALGGAQLEVSNVDNGQPFTVTGDSLVTSSFSADQFGEEKKISKTHAAELLINAYNRPFTVVFTKQDGTERILRGRLVQPEPLLGRSHVEDLDIAYDDKKGRLRLVDHRTIRSLTLDGIKYVVKD